MATFFELRLVHEDAAYARQAAQAAFQVAARLDKLLNRYRDDSEITRIRYLSENEPLRLSIDTFQCLQLAAQMQQVTGGAFDPGLGRQMDDWRSNTKPAGDVRIPERGSLIIDPKNFTVWVSGGSVALDLGAIGKGFALDCMAEELRTWDVTRALLVAGESSILALDAPDPDSAGWEVSLTVNEKVFLKNEAIGASGTSVKGSHILDPQTGQSMAGFYRTWAVHPSAATADALSTAWMVLSPREIEEVCRKLPGTQAILQSYMTEVESLHRIGPFSGAMSAVPPESPHGTDL